MRPFFTPLFLPIVIFVSSSYAQKPFRVHGKLDPVFTGSRISLTIANDEGFKPESPKITTTIKNSSFTIEGALPVPAATGTLTVMAGGKKYQSIFVIDTGVNEITLTLKKGSYRFKTRVRNSVSNIIYSKVDSIWDSAFIAKQKTKGTYDLTGAERINIQREILRTLENFESNYYSLVRVYESSTYVEMSDQEELILSVLDRFDLHLKESSLGILLKQKLKNSLDAKNATKTGQPVPLFTVKKFNGDIFTNESLAGKPYLIAFSATWCRPCRELEPQLLSLYNKYQKEGFEVVYFNLDDEYSNWAKHISSSKMTWINVSERTKLATSVIAQQFNARTIPMYLVVNRDGNIVFNGYEARYNYKDLEKYIIVALRSATKH